MSTINWKLLKEYKCPIITCESPLREVKGITQEETYHKCTLCDFHISDKKLSDMVVIRHRKLQPPAFIEEMRNQGELNNL